MTLPHDYARCHHAIADTCPKAAQCARTDEGRKVMQPYSVFPGGDDCEGFIEKEEGA